VAVWSLVLVRSNGCPDKPSVQLGGFIERGKKMSRKKGITSFICRPKEVKTLTDQYSGNTTKSTSDKCLDVVYC